MSGERWTATAELCPACHHPNIAGNKYCYGRPGTQHDKIADWLERDRREPDKVLCYVQSLRRLALPPADGNTEEEG